jgi:hypothetical protein
MTAPMLVAIKFARDDDEPAIQGLVSEISN